MNPDLFSLREHEIFNTLQALESLDFVIIGGYAVNAYTLPRFSVDCDLVIKDENELQKIEKILLKMSYKKEKLPREAQYKGHFCRYEKKLDNNLTVSIDLLIERVIDRMTNSQFSADWIFKNSSIKLLKGKTLTKELKVRIINIDALLVMKIISCRSTDIRDVFMMFPNAKDKDWIKSEIQLRYSFHGRLNIIIEKICSKQFKDGLSGVFGNIDLKVFEKHKNFLLNFASK